MNLFQKPGNSPEFILAQRTRCLTLVVEDLYQSHNAGAIVRACDFFGILDLHVISLRNRFDLQAEFTRDMNQWLTIHRYEKRGTGHPTAECLDALRQQGYRIAATTLRSDSVPLSDCPMDRKTALCLGTEEKGLSETAHAMADLFVQIPMLGFTQSFNVSVCAALCLQTLSAKLRASTIAWQLNPAEARALARSWHLREPNP